jgi:hypothetical protein
MARPANDKPLLSRVPLGPDTKQRLAALCEELRARDIDPGISRAAGIILDHALEGDTGAALLRRHFGKEPPD